MERFNTLCLQDEPNLRPDRYTMDKNTLGGAQPISVLKCPGQKQTLWLDGQPPWVATHLDGFDHFQFVDIHHRYIATDAVGGQQVFFIR